MSSTSYSTASLSSSPTHSASGSFGHVSVSSFTPSEIRCVQDALAFNPSAYLVNHKAAYSERRKLGCGNSPRIDKLFSFWATFLVDSFNGPMYTRFQKMAEEDAACGATYGLDLLFSFYRCRLAKHFEAGLFFDFEQLAHKYVDYISYWPGMILLLDLHSACEIPSDLAVWDSKTAAYMKYHIQAAHNFECESHHFLYHGGGSAQGDNAAGGISARGGEYADTGGRAIQMGQLAAGSKRRRRRGLTQAKVRSLSQGLPMLLMLELASPPHPAKRDPLHKHWQHRPSNKASDGRESQQVLLMQQLRMKLWMQNQEDVKPMPDDHGLPLRLGETLGD
eukprot:gene1765-33179_t